MSLCLLLILSLSSCGYGYNTKRQVGDYYWYDQVVLPTITSVHNELYQQIPERTAVVFMPQHSEPKNDRITEPEQVSMDYRFARVYPVLIHFLSPEPLEQSGDLEEQYQLTLEPVPQYKMMEIRESKFSEQERSDSQPKNETKAAQHFQFGTKITTSKISEKKSSFKTHTQSTNEQ